MNSHGSVAKKVREHKEKHPELYCRHPKCLKRVVTGNGVELCRKHPNYGATTPELERLNAHLEEYNRRQRERAAKPQACADSPEV